MIDVATLRAMAAAGASVEVILAAIEADQKAKLEKVTVRRAKDAARQRRRRVSHGVTRSHAESHAVTRTPCDPPTHISSPQKSSEPKRVPRIAASVLRADWTLSEANRDFARSKSWDESKIQREAERFKDHALARDRKQKNWDAAWRMWVTSPYQDAQNGTGNRNRSNISDVADDLIARAEAAERAAGAGEPEPFTIEGVRGR